LSVEVLCGQHVDPELRVWQVVDQALSGNIDALLLDRDLPEADLFQVLIILESRMVWKEV
jgi:hypothetical protein